MQIQFFGAARTVTGSKHLITTEKGTRILLDCGLFQGINTDEFNQDFGFKPSEVDYLVLSHAHIDHSGLIPRLVRQGFTGPIYCTDATADLCEIMLYDSAYIQEKDIKRINERRSRQGRATIDQLYGPEDVAQALSQIKTVPYGRPFTLGNEVEVFFTDAGHLIGSAAVHLVIPDKGGFQRLTFTGDIGRPHDRILRAPEVFPQADLLICESTYGNRLHEVESEMLEHLVRIVKQTCVEKRGKLIIPAFAVDRTQELIYALDQLSSSGLLPRIPVYIDSPLAIKATSVMKKHDECFNPEILDYIEKDGDAFAFPNLHYISKVEDSKALNSKEEPCIIISASGMAEAGRIKHHLRNNIENPANTVLMVGYCAPNSLGGAIKNGEKEVKIFGEVCRVNASVAVMDSFSGHGDYNEMLQFLSCQNPALLKRTFLVHGEYETQIAFKLKLEDAGFRHIEIPSYRQNIPI